jgi:hypothetical protein
MLQTLAMLDFIAKLFIESIAELQAVEPLTIFTMVLSVLTCIY